MGTNPQRRRSDAPQLTAREREALELLIEPAGNTKAIAARMGISPRTVKAFFARCFLKFGIRDGVKRVKLAVAYVRMKQGTK